MTPRRALLHVERCGSYPPPPTNRGVLITWALSDLTSWIAAFPLRLQLLPLLAAVPSDHILSTRRCSGATLT